MFHKNLKVTNLKDFLKIHNGRTLKKEGANGLLCHGRRAILAR